MPPVSVRLVPSAVENVYDDGSLAPATL